MLLKLLGSLFASFRDFGLPLFLLSGPKRAHVGAMLSLLDGLLGCDPGFYVVW